MTTLPLASPSTSSRPWPLITFPLISLIVHLAVIRGYGIFRDELYYIACSKRLAWGYVDHPPLSVAVLRFVRETLGDGLIAIRLVPAVAGAVLVLLIGLITRRLGGNAVAQSLAMVATLAVPYTWAIGHIYSMNIFDSLIWASVAYLLLRPAAGSDLPARTLAPSWPLLGIVLGLGLLNKLSVLWLGLGLAVGLVATPNRRWLRTPGPWVAAGIAAMLIAPHIAWQIHHGWPTLEFIANATGQKMVAVSPLDFVRGQIDLLGGYLVTSVAAVGLATLWFGFAGRFRLLAWIYLTVFTLLVANGTSRAGYLAPAYAWLLAAGGVGTAHLLSRIRRDMLRRLTTASVFAMIGIYGAFAAPFALPILDVDTFVRYARWLGIEPETAERKELAALPQFYADMHGWQAKVDGARAAFESLPPADQAEACFFSGNYGVAGAIEHLGGDDLPPSLSGHNNHWLWGPDRCSGAVMIFMGGRVEALREAFAHVERVGQVDCAYCMPYENEQPIFVARGPRTDMTFAWDSVKHFD